MCDNLYQGGVLGALFGRSNETGTFIMLFLNHLPQSSRKA